MGREGSGQFRSLADTVGAVTVKHAPAPSPSPRRGATGRRKALRRGVGMVLITSMGLVASLAFESWRHRIVLEQAAREMAAGRFGAARQRLIGLAASWPDRGEASYQLGACEQALGRLDAALAAWEGVPIGSEPGARAALGRAKLLMGRGRFAEAERLLSDALGRPGPHLHDAIFVMAVLLRQQARLEEMPGLFHRDWKLTTDPVYLLRQLWRLDAVAFPDEATLELLELLAKQAPDDERIWLGRAILMTRLGRFAEAARWFDACLGRNPDDPVLWRYRLAWARAADRPDEAWRALDHIPVDPTVAAQAPALRAWFAARRDDRDAERHALEEWVRREPFVTRAVARLAELEFRAGRLDRAAELRRREAELAGMRSRYQELLNATDPLLHAAELARLAEGLGLAFEAQCWADLLARRQPGRPGIPANLAGRGPQPTATPPPIVRTLADLLADLGPPPAQLRPETSSPGQAPTFRDDAELAGLRFVHDNGESPERQLPESTSGGVAVLDYDGDGWLDVYCVQGGPFPPANNTPSGDRLFRNQGDGTFKDVTEASGLAALARGYGHGATVGDIDNDGRPDLLLTRWRAYQLLRNRGDRTFEDVTETYGLGGDRDWPTSAALADLDHDGDLDLYVCHYLQWDAASPRTCRNPQGAVVYCSPLEGEPAPDHLFRNDGGRFVDVSAEAGIVDRHGRGLGVVAADLDGDGRVDLYVANDLSANYLFRNQGDLKFEEMGYAAGAAVNSAGTFLAGMGVACGDLDGDGLPELAVTNFYGECATLYRNLGRGVFSDQTAGSGLDVATRHVLGFGIAFFDADNDGLRDVAIANGHVNDMRPHFPYAMPAQLLLGGDRGRLTDVSAVAGPPWLVPRLGRGLAAADLDNDGRVDILILSQNGPLAYLHNRTAPERHFVTFLLEGAASNRDGIGARVTVDAGGRRLVACRVGGGSYQSASDPRLHFGLGAADRVASLEVAWPSGRVDRHHDLAADRLYRVIEGAAVPVPLSDPIDDRRDAPSSLDGSE